MHRSCLIIASSLAAFCSSVLAQTFNPRSADYLFAATADDARAIWLNPAGLAVVPEASLLAEFVVRDAPDTEPRLAQWTLGFNTQGLAFGYKQDRPDSGITNHVYRLGLARALQRWAIGIGFSYYKSDHADRGLDVGVRYKLARPLDLGLVVRNIGQPGIRADSLPLSGVASIGWMPLPERLTVAGEAVVQDRLAESGLDLAYRVGASFSVGRAVPVTGLVAVLFDDQLGPTLVSLGISVGGGRRAVVVTSLDTDEPSTGIQSVSVTGLARNRLAPGRR